MVTLELPQARRLAASVVLGQVVITVVAAAICFAVWGRIAGLSALVGGGISAIASAALALIGFAAPAGAAAERVARAFYVGEAAKLGRDGRAVRGGFRDDEGFVRRAVRRLHRHIVRVLDCARECAAAAGRDRDRRKALGTRVDVSS